MSDVYMPVCKEAVGIYVPSPIFQESLCGLPLCFANSQKVIPIFFVGKAECNGCTTIDVNIELQPDPNFDILYDPIRCFDYLNSNTTMKIPTPSNETISLLEVIVNMVNEAGAFSWIPLAPQPNEVPVITFPNLEPAPDVRLPSAPEEIVIEPEQQRTASPVTVPAEPIAIANAGNQTPRNEVQSPPQVSQVSQPEAQVATGENNTPNTILSSASSLVLFSFVSLLPFLV
jgi:hypothetical protein